MLTDVSEERIASILRVERSASGQPVSAGGCRLSHHGKQPLYKISEGGSVGHMRNQQRGDG
jgi:hypothetical protein